MDRTTSILRLCRSCLGLQSKSGKAATTMGKAVNTNVPDAPMASMRGRGIDMKNVLELGPGHYAIRIVIRDNLTGKISSVTAPLTVD